MKKVILFFVLFCMVLAMGSNVNALTTSQTLDGSTNPEWFLPDSFPYQPGTLIDYRHIPPTNYINPYYRGYEEDWGWTHDVTFEDLGGTMEILGATLTIEAWDVDDDGENLGRSEPDQLDIIKVGTSSGHGGVELGNLTGDDDGWSTTTFTLDAEALAKLQVTDGSGELKVWMDISSLEGTPGWTTNVWYVTLKSATLTVDYIPAPGAILLGSLGAGVVGWLRRRKTL